VTPLHWAAPPAALEATAVAGSEAVGHLLGLRAIERDGVTVYRGAGWTIVTGSAERLPWVDGVIYLGHLPGTTRVLVPVHEVPVEPADIVHAAVRRVTGDATATAALLPGPAGGHIVVLAP
jgi:hypothetical protein